MSDPYEELRERAERLDLESRAELDGLLAECVKLLAEVDPGQRKKWLPAVLKELYLKQGGRCALCNERMDHGAGHVDHIVPVSQGGRNESGNIQLTHARCNLEKGTSVSPEQLLRYLEDRYMNLKS